MICTGLVIANRHENDNSPGGCQGCYRPARAQASALRSNVLVPGKAGWRVGTRQAAMLAELSECDVIVWSRKPERPVVVGWDGCVR
jgi:hypothetical protein